MWKGKIVKTVGGLKKSALVKSKTGKIVSAKKSALAKKGKIGKWAKAFVAARKALGKRFLETWINFLMMGLVFQLRHRSLNCLAFKMSILYLGLVLPYTCLPGYTRYGPLA